MIIILSKILIIFSMMAVGLIANRIGVLPGESNKYLIALLMKITTPCMLVETITSAEMTPELVKISIGMLLGSLAYYIVATVLAYFYTRGLVRRGKVLAADAGIYICLFTLANNGYMGYPIMQMIFSDYGLYLMVLCNIMLNIWGFTGGFIEVHLLEESGAGFSFESIKKNARAMLNPVTVAAVLGMIMLFSGLHFPEIPNEIISTVAKMTVPLSMIVIGVQLGESNIKRLFFRPDLLRMSFIRLLLIPACMTLAVYFLPIQDGMIKLTLVMSAAFPAAVTSVMVATAEGKNGTLASEGVAHSTALSLITLPLWIVILSRLFL